MCCPRWNSVASAAPLPIAAAMSPMAFAAPGGFRAFTLQRLGALPEVAQIVFIRLCLADAAANLVQLRPHRLDVRHQLVDRTLAGLPGEHGVHRQEMRGHFHAGRLSLCLQPGLQTGQRARDFGAHGVEKPVRLGRRRRLDEERMVIDGATTTLRSAESCRRPLEALLSWLPRPCRARSEKSVSSPSQARM